MRINSMRKLRRLTKLKERVHRLTAILLLLCMLASNTKIVKAENSEKISFEATDYTLTASSLFDIEDGE